MADLSGKKIGLSDFETQVVSFFCDGVRILGLPKSIGEIYGLLFVSPEPLALDDFVTKLNISKGSASQGIRLLRELGAVSEAEGKVARRSYYEPDIELKKLVGGFIKEQVRPHLASGEDKLSVLRGMVKSMEGEEELADFYSQRVERLGRWSSRARMVLPVLQKLLGK